MGDPTAPDRATKVNGQLGHDPPVSHSSPTLLACHLRPDLDLDPGLKWNPYRGLRLAE